MKKLSINELKRMIVEEKANIGAGESTEKRAKETREVDACEYADTLEHQLNFMKALKIEQRRLQAKLTRINEQLESTKKLKIVKE